MNHSNRSRSRSPSLPIKRENSEEFFDHQKREPNGHSDRRDFDSRGEKPRSKMVTISNLPYEVTWMELKNIIREKVGDVVFVEVLEKDGRSKGRAIVELKTYEAVEKCVEAMDQHEIRGRRMKVNAIRDPPSFFRRIIKETGVDYLSRRERNSNNDSQHRPPARNSNARTQSSTGSNYETYGLSASFLDQLQIKLPLVDRVFITNIALKSSSGRLFDVCSLAGKVAWLDLQVDKEGRTKGMAICQYSHPIEAVQAISMLHGQKFFDQSLSVKLDRVPDNGPMRGSKDGKMPIGLQGVGPGLGALGAPLTNVASLFSSPPSNLNASQMPANGAQANVSARNESFLLAQQPANPYGGSTSVNSAFPASHGIRESNVLASQQAINSAQAILNQLNTIQQQQQIDNREQPMHTPQTYMQQSSASMQQIPFRHYDSANQSFNQPMTSNIRSNPSPGASYHQREVDLRQMGKDNYGSTGDSSSIKMGDIDSGYDKSSLSGGIMDGWRSASGPQAASSRTVLIKNLPTDYTWQIVGDRVQQFGELESVEMIAPGIAKVRFVRLADADSMKSVLKGTTVEGRLIELE
ncbi:RNA recognition motif domain-containing protein [Ditylenchus destructor]|uniref:RNA recognition motif domain-containing protein n=1 Tax=Ditylenchus destructor TaxID=166010 RepID=A0AAD4MY42_9BILA|nr:RNA recognition motif domain-containing protein [Ditylenchus destructor]